jgi:Protein of unknown function (DUF2911)
MKKILKWVAIVAVVLFGAYKFMQYRTKQASPETTVSLKKDGLEIEVKYSQPSKKGREVFGTLVPFGKVWRTGANEATTFETNQDLKIGGTVLPKGEYTLWTIPEADHWTVIFNKGQYGWGVKISDGLASRDASLDVAQIQVPVQALTESIEKFTISLDAAAAPASMSLAWDKTKVTVPLQ